MDYLGQVRPKKRIPLKKAEAVAKKIYARLEPLTEFMMVAGSIRRRRPEIGDIEFVVLPRNMEEFMNALGEMGFSGGTRKAVAVPRKGPKIEIYLAHKPEEIGAMLFTYTGDYLWNIAMRSIAKRRGWKLDQYGIQDAQTGDWILQSPYEEDFFGALGVDYHTPEERSLAHRSKGSSMGALGPREWSPRGDYSGSPNNLILKNVGWDGHEWREPDTKGDFDWIWYGPGGREGEHATTLQRAGDGWMIQEYHFLGNVNPPQFLKLTAFISDDLLAGAISRARGIEMKLKDPDDIGPEVFEWARWAVGFGTAYISYYGGSEQWTDRLP